jgi:DNA-binding NarL/FixJ family response regulator
MAHGMTQKMIAFEFGISIKTVGNIAANAYRKAGVHGAAAAVHAHRDTHVFCGSRVDFGSVRGRLNAGHSP